MDDLKRGSIVRIADYCRRTRDSWGYNNAMKKMEGTVQKVDRLDEYSNGVILKGSDSTWHKEDLELITTPKDLTIPISKDQQSTFTFDPEEI